MHWEVNVAAVLFDMDGTLVDSSHVVNTLWAQFCARYGIAVDELLAFANGRPTEDTVARFAPAGVDIQKEVNWFNAQECVFTEGTVATPGAIEFMAMLPTDRVALVTSAPQFVAEKRLETVRIRVPKIVVTADHVAAGKPAPDIYLEAAKLFGVPASQCLVFEDSVAGIQSAVDSGAHTVVVGDEADPVTQGLPRIADFRGLTVRAAPGGLLHIAWTAPSA